MERRRRRWWTVAVTGASVLVIGAALVSGLFQLAVRAMPGYREQLSDRLAAVLGRPVEIGALQLSWRGYYPSLDLDRVSLLPREPQGEIFSAERLRVAFSLPRLARGDWMPARVDLIGAELSATRDSEGKVHVRGFEPGADSDPQEALRRFAQLARLRLTRCVLTWTDQPLEITDYRFEINRLDLQQDADSFEINVELGLPATLGQTLSLHTELDGRLAEPSSWSGPWVAYLRGFGGEAPWIKDALMSGASLSVERARLRLKGEMQAGQVPALTADWESGAISLSGGAEPLQLKSLAASAQLARHAEGWSADLQRLEVQSKHGDWPVTRGNLKFSRLQDEGYELNASADFLRLQDLAPALDLVRSMPKEIAALHDSVGEVERLVLRWRHQGEQDQYSVSAGVKNVGIPAAGRPVGVAGVTGELSADDNGGHLKVRDIPLELRLPRAFKAPVPFEAFTGTINWTRAGKDWRVRIPDFHWRLLGSTGEGSVALELPKEDPVRLKLGARFAAKDATRFKPYIPAQWGKDLDRWLSRAVQAGRVPQGELAIEGPVSDFPFHKTRNGVFKLDIDVADGRLAFQPDWPVLTQLGARLKFRGNSLAIDSDGANLLGARIQQVTARFDDFHEALLVIDGKVSGELPQLYRIIEQSPLVKTLGALVRHTRATGPAQVALHLDIPLKHGAETQSSGTITLKDTNLEYLGLKEPVRGIAGEIAFAPQGVSSRELKGQFYELPVQATLTAEAPHMSRLVAGFRYAPQPDGKGVSELVPSWIRGRLKGESAWRAELGLGSAGDSVLRLISDTKGTAVDLPAPLGKSADEAVPLTVRISGDDRVPLRIGLDYRDRLAADLHFSDPKKAQGSLLTGGVLKLGGGETVIARDPGLIVTGRAQELDFAAWSAALSALGGSEQLSVLKSAELDVDKPIVHGQTLLPTHIRYLALNAGPQPGGWQVQLSGEGAQGLMTWHNADGGRISARLQHLALNYKNKEGSPGDKSEAPTDPGKLPLVDVDCVRLKVSGVDFGHLRLQSERIPNGQKLAALKFEGGAVDLTGTGQWWRREGLSGANLSFHLASPQTADVLRALDYLPNLSAKKSQFDGDLLWAPSPRGIELAHARGHVSLEIESGNLQAIEPGAGRVLGLLNFYALPRRLTLNFRDVLGKGLGFDRITGGFDVADGDARTEDLAIDGPSLRMEIRGRVGLVARDYDQRVTVYPDLSSGVTLGALLLGGPAVGALVLLAQQILDKPLDQVTQLTYHLGGSWDNPEVKRVDAKTIEAAARKKPAPPRGKP
jgi:uncharacterized protein (TIGR02099 family)